MLKPNIKRACLAAVVLIPMTADGSFGGAPCADDFTCHLVTWGVLIGTVGVPLSALIFAVLHLVFCNGARLKVNQFLLGGLIGIVAYEVAVACGALIGTSGIAVPGKQTDYLVTGFVATYAALAIASVFYARSSPRLHGEGDAAD
jgi:uncharacterized BrkB/YihY/UPF0761 family membrane protein